MICLPFRHRSPLPAIKFFRWKLIRSDEFYLTQFSTPPYNNVYGFKPVNFNPINNKNLTWSIYFTIYIYICNWGCCLFVYMRWSLLCTKFKDKFRNFSIFILRKVIYTVLKLLKIHQETYTHNCSRKITCEPFPVLSNFHK